MRHLFAAAPPLFVLACRAESSGRTWKFAVSGDSRNCGDIVMPAITAEFTKAARFSTGIWATSAPSTNWMKICPRQCSSACTTSLWRRLRT